MDDRYIDSQIAKSSSLVVLRGNALLDPAQCVNQCSQTALRCSNAVSSNLLRVTSKHVDQYIELLQCTD